ncbi:Rpn family recombination-promoting nuclease/putative transposase [Kyrpidia tusciae]|uniref:Rpn family recombination-promoting nuclease/putative transposase n=1 Tax=Kyrpidia tusciae TaxID=33943 RepID=UPI000312DEBC|nr:Rpn family recombination-promoting nuclease/putative transposase [Kyrpidia tusciae]
MGSSLERWMRFLSAETREEMEELTKEDPMIRKALTTLESLSQDPEIRRLYEERVKWLERHSADMEGAWQAGSEEGMKQGREEGRKEGREEGYLAAKREMARSLLRMGDNMNKVLEITKLPKEEVEAIQRELEGDR